MSKTKSLRPAYEELVKLVFMYMDGDPNGECGCEICQYAMDLKVRLEQVIGEQETK